MEKKILCAIACILFLSDSVPVKKDLEIEPDNYIASVEPADCRYITDVNVFIERVPRYPDVILSTDRCGLLPGNDVALVIDMFYKEYKKRFGDDGKLKNALKYFVIHASPNPKKIKNLYTTGGEHLDESFVNGLFIKPNYIWLHVIPGSSIDDTAMIHELVHYALFITLSEPDPDHEGNVYKAWTKEHTTFISNLAFDLRESMNRKTAN